MSWIRPWHFKLVSSSIRISLIVLLTTFVYGEDVVQMNVEDFEPKSNSQKGWKDIEPQNLTVYGDRRVNTAQFSWRSTGLCPPQPHQDADKFLLSNDMAHNLAFIGAIPHNGIEHVRIHWLLDLVKISGFSGGRPLYDFNRLDSLISLLRSNGLRPGFELMGNPSNFFTDFEKKEQVFLWKNLIQTLAKNYIDQYGVGYVSTWNFETWNEPDHKDFDGLKMTIKGFLNYYDACSEGLTAASPLLKFGGPGASCRDTSFSKMCWALLQHVSNGTNYFTGERGVRMDFISFHKKGGKTSPYTDGIISQNYGTMQQIWIDYPPLRKVPVYNDEGDPLVGWSKPQTWRADVRYAAMVATVIQEHLVHREGYFPMNFSLLSNDNAFLSYNPDFFTQRTLLARFQMNNTSPPHVQFIRKPVHSVMGLLSLIGEKGLWMTQPYIYGLRGLASIHIPEDNSSSDSTFVSILFVRSRDTEEDGRNATVRVSLQQPKELEGKDVIMVHYQIDAMHGNPYSVWLKQGKPSSPSWQQFQRMRAAEGISRIYGPAPLEFEKGKTSFEVHLPLPGIFFGHICAKPLSNPDQVPNVSIKNITAGSVLITWSDSCVHSKCLLTYEVEYSSTEDGDFTRINIKDETFTVFVYSPDASALKAEGMVRGYYRIRAVDYWRRPAEYSLVASYGR